ncbi:DUF4347 domain-containing protein [Kordiimonas sp.]|uniref:DUF4347 domain-containing protein n=1 Tax=Kordiimonas sp. TaxID=1970157 RepID=UPI003A939D6F
MTNYKAVYGFDREAARELLIIDPDVKDVEILLDELSPSVEIVYLNKCQNPLFQIAQALASHTRIETVHILAHGSPGMLHLGGVDVDEAYLHTQEGMLTAINALLADDAEIALWACSVAWTSRGESFMRTLAAGAGVKVYGTDRPVGAEALGGHWDIGVPAPFTKAAQSSYPHTLPMFDFSSGSLSSGDTVYTETQNGVTMTVTFTGGTVIMSSVGGGGGSDGVFVFTPGGQSVTNVTFEFSENILINRLQHIEIDNSVTDHPVYRVTEGSPRAVLYAYGHFSSIEGVQGFNPGDTSTFPFSNAGNLIITMDAGGTFNPGFDNLVFNQYAPEFDDADDTVSLTVDENDGATTIPGLAVTDDNEGDTLTWTVLSGPSKGAVTLTGTATATSIGGDLPGTYTYTPDADTSGSDSFTVQVSDGIDTDTLTVNVTIVPDNTAPVITLPASPSVTEDATNVAIADTIEIADAEDNDQTVTLTVTGGTVSLDGTDLDFTVGDGNDDATMTFSGTEAEVNAALDSLTFTPTANLNGIGAASINIVTTDSEGANDDETITIDIDAANDAPTVTGLSDELSFAEDTEGNVDLTGVTVADIDGDTVTVTLTVSGGSFTTLADGQDVGAGVEEVTLAPPVITLEGTPDDINTYLSTAGNIRYTGAENVNGEGAATLTVSVSDNVTSASDTANIDISAVNDAPSASGMPTEVSGNEDTAISLDLDGVALTDVDDTELTLTLTASSGTISAGGERGITIEDNGTAEVTIAGTISALNTYLATDSVTFTGDEDENGDDYATVTIEADDGDGQVELGTITVDVDAVNDAPTIYGVPEGITVAEDTATYLSLSDVEVTDVDGDTLTVTITANEGSFSTPATMSGVTATLVDAQTITLTGGASNINSYFDQASAIEYTGAENENGVNADRITLSVSDGTLSADGIALVTITAVDDAAVVSGTTTGAVTEGDEGDRAATATGSITISDVDTGDNPSFADVAETAGDNAYGSFSLTAGEWTYTLDQSAVQDLDDGDTVTDTITFTATDDTEQQITVTITGTDDEAEVSGAFTGRVSTTGDATASGALTISDADEDDTPAFSDVTSTAGDNGYGTFELTGGSWSYTLDRAAVVAQGAGDTLTDTFTFTASDRTTQTVTVTIEGGNDAPSGPRLVSSGVNEDEAGAFVGTLHATDPEGDDITFIVADSRFKVVGNELYLADGVALDYEEIQSLSIKVTASDGGKGSSSLLDVNVKDIIEPIVNKPTNGNDEAMGGGGRDTLTGGAGDDTLDGGMGDDTIIKDDDDDGQDVLVGGGGNDIIRSGGGNDFIIGDGASDGSTRQTIPQNSDTSSDGSDTIRGGAGDDTILGGGWDDDLVNDNGRYDDGEEIASGSGQNRIWAGAGSDVAVGSGGADMIGGSTGDDKLIGLGGDDTLFGNVGDDLVLGGAGDDLAYNGSGNDTVDGGAGDDTLWAGAGDDQLTGGAGADTFCFGSTSGNDVVTDFNLDEDTLHLAYRNDFESLDDVLAASSETTVGGSAGVMIDFGNGESAFLVGLTLDDLGSAQITL